MSKKYAVRMIHHKALKRIAKEIGPGMTANRLHDMILDEYVKGYNCESLDEAVSTIIKESYVNMFHREDQPTHVGVGKEN